MHDEENRPEPQPPEPEAPAAGVAPAAPPPSTEANPLDSLMLSPEEALKADELRAASTPAEVEPGPQEPKEEAALLPEQIERICKAMDQLARKGLNLRAVIALLHDANPTIPKKHIKAVLEGLRELPAIYGKSSRNI